VSNKLVSNGLSDKDESEELERWDFIIVGIISQKMPYKNNKLLVSEHLVLN
jgi:hypothetical protein